MKKYISAIMLLLLAVCICACAKKEAQRWDISLAVAENSSEDLYVTTWNTTENIVSETGCFSIQNRNLFDITVHLMTEGEEELVLEIPAGGCSIQYQIKKAVPYQLGIHADKEEGTPLEIMVYDGNNTDAEPF